MIDYHLHTPLCRHAVKSMDLYVRRAISLGLSEICFLDHLILTPPNNSKSMSLSEVPLYYHAIQILKNRYQEFIIVKGGLEIDFQPEVMNIVERLTASFAFDAVGASVHFVDGLDIVSRSAVQTHQHLNPDLLYSHYLEKLRKMLDFSFYDFICHFDLPKKFGKKIHGSYKTELDEILSLIKQKGIALEVNTAGYDHPAGEAYPSPGILVLCHDLDIPITLGSDAHSPDDIGRYYGRMLDQIRQIGYGHLTGFSKRIPYPIPLEDKWIITHKFNRSKDL
ncbi:MAG: histidinol-phosphatase [Thermodesulfobacteriota bacterium]